VATLAGLLLICGAPRVQPAPAAQVEVLGDLEGDFSLIHNVSALPPALLGAWREEGDARSAGFPAARSHPFKPQPSEPQPLSMADPGQPFQDGCIVEAGVPRSRLILAGCSSRRCFIEYETNGYAHSVHLIGFSAGEKPHVLWTGQITSEGKSLKSLRGLVGQDWWPNKS
jgi:hypothetical protein